MGRGTLGRRRGPSRTPSGPGEQLGPVLQAEWRQGGLAVVTQSPCWGEDCGVPAHWPSRRMLWEALRSWELRENAQWQVRCFPSLPPLSSVPTAPWRAELRERAFSAPAQPRASPGCRSPPPPSSGFSLAVFGSGGRPALPLSLRHHRLCGAGRGRDRAWAGWPSPPGIQLRSRLAAVATETKQQREAENAAGWG